ncbi:MAG: hypothetical protein QM541_01340 [Flavobacterium sp.]|nr:hypothetical protein [Flavobacterium sp.]
MNSKTQPIQSENFEILESTDDSVVFKISSPEKKASTKEMRAMRVLRNAENMPIQGLVLPTTTLHFFNYEDFKRLKEIEKEILSEPANDKGGKSFLKKVSEFLEL